MQTPQQQALSRLQEALGKLYHNASIPSAVWSLDINSLSGGAELVKLLDANHNPKRGGFNPKPSETWQNARYDNWLQFAVEDAVQYLSELEGVEDVYQWGRGGKTLAPSAWVNTHGGGGFTIKRAEALADAYDNGGTDCHLGAVAEYLDGVNGLAATVEAFNERQEALRQGLAADWQAYLQEAVNEHLEELQQAQRQAQAAAKAAALYTLNTTAQGAAININARWAADCWAYAQGHPNARPWADIESIPMPTSASRL